MAPPKAPPQTVAEYIAAAPKEARTRLRELRKCVRTAAPGAVESLKWRMPAYSYQRILVMFAAFKHHVSFFPTALAVRAFAKDLRNFTTSPGTIRFPLDKPIPAVLVRKITAFRAKDSLKKDDKWRS